MRKGEVGSEGGGGRGSGEEETRLGDGGRVRGVS